MKIQVIEFCETTDTERVLTDLDQTGYWIRNIYLTDDGNTFIIWAQPKSESFIIWAQLKSEFREQPAEQVRENPLSV